MDSILTEFIQRSKADPALAQDLLEATEWNMEAALLAYESLQETRVVEPPEYEYNPSKYTVGVCMYMHVHACILIWSTLWHYLFV